MIQEIASVTSILKSIENNTLRPVPSVSWTGLDERQAYHVQKRLVSALQEKGEHIVGFKAGLTRAGAAQKFELNSAITGVLFASAEIKDLSSLSLTGSHRLMIEQELAFLLAADINHKIPDIASLKGHFSHLTYALEFPDLGFASRPNGFDIIANNAVNRFFYRGDWQAIADNVDNLKVKLLCDNRQVNTGHSSDVMEGQWQTLLWMVNALQAQGYALKKGHILITGNLGDLIPAQMCRYNADFSELGQLQFSITP